MSYLPRLRTSYLLVLVPLLFLGAGPSLTVEPSVFRTDDHLLISEAVVTPTSDEFIEIANPTAAAIALDDYYLSDDEDYALLPAVTGTGPTPSIAASDFIVRFPAGATIPAGGVLVVAFDGAGFLGTFGFAADFEVHGTDAGTPDMIATDVGSATAGLTNSGENVVLFAWDGVSDLVTDVDMVNIGTPSSTNDIGNKTGLSVDGPDADAVASPYLTDAVTMPQQAGDPGVGTSTKRIFLEVGNEATVGGNGITGDDETTETITTTWDAPPFSAPNPGVADIFPPPPEIIITEIMPDPSAVSDANGEWFEVFNPTASAINIDGWTIEDNGSDNHVISNGGPLPVPAGGFLVLARNADSGTNGGVTVDYEYSGITLANGDDEVVLIDNFSNEIDRVEYDGGPNFPDPTGASMALIDPSLDNNVGANWCTSSTAFGDGDLGTPGAANDCPPPTVPEIVITEIIQNPDAVSDANGEWFEVFNPTASAININGWTIKDNDSDSHVINNGGPLPVPAGGFLVLARNANAATNGGVTVDYQYSGIFLGNGADELVLVDNFSNEIDRVEWDGGTTFPDPTGASMSLIAAALDNNAGGNWCEATTPFGDGDLGTPGALNDCPPPEIVITEIIQNPAAVSDTNGEWFEVFNPTASAININGWTIKDDGSDSHMINNGGPLLVPAGGFLVLARNANAATNGGVTVDYQYSGIFLGNGTDELVLLDLNLAEVDRVNWDNGATFPDPTGASMSLIGASFDNNVGANWCTATTPFGDGDLGTPGAFNDCNVEIFTIQGDGLFSPFEDQEVTTRNNVVTCLALNGFFMQTPTARSDGDVDTSDGIFVFTGATPTVAVGNLVDVTGEVIEFSDELTEFSNNPTVTVVGNDPALVPPAVVFNATTPSPDPTAPSCSVNNFECFEGMLVEITGGRVTASNQRFSSDIIAEVFIVAGPDRAFREPGVAFPGLGMPPIPTWDGNPEVFELDPDKLGLPNQIIPAGSSFDARGVLSSEFNGYEIWPNELSVTPAPLPVAVPERGDGKATVGSLNLFRLFDDIDDPSTMTSQGRTRNDFVVGTAEYDRRRAKFAQYILDVLRAPDILAVQEAEKLEVLEDLAAEISGIDPGVVYTSYLVEGNDVGTIDIGFMVRESVLVDAVTQLGKEEILAFDGSLLHDRPPLLLEGRFIFNGEPTLPVAVLGVHNRSFSGIDDSERVREKRLQQAKSIARMVQGFQTDNPNVGLVVTGDFNDFEFTDGFVDAIGRIIGDFDDATDLVDDSEDLVDPNLTNQVLSLPTGERYSFIFRGSAQVLDHALTSTTLDPAVAGFAYGRGNADAAIDLINDATTPLRSSDHDGLALYLDIAPPDIVASLLPTEGNDDDDDGDDDDDSFAAKGADDGDDDDGDDDEGEDIEGTFTVACSATDNCDDNPSVSSVIVVPTLSNPDVEFEVDDEKKVKIDLEENEVEVEAPDPQAFWAEIQSAGGIAVVAGQVIDVEQEGGEDEYEFEFDDDGNLVSVEGPSVVLRCTASDGAGNTASVEVGPGESVGEAAAAPARLAETSEDAETATLQEIPTEFALAPNYPNPFNPTTTIEFALPEAVEVTLQVYDVTGRVVARLVEESMSAGTHRVAFDASMLPSGVYLYRIQAGRFTEVRRMVLVK